MRSFIAVELDPGIKKAILTAASRLHKDGLNASWVKDSGIHLTLKFLGEIDPKQTPEISSALEEAAEAIQPFEIQVCGLGAFPNRRRPRVIWAGVEEKSGALRNLWKGIEDSLSRLGFKKEGREFHPHITFGRIRKSPIDITTSLQEPFDAGEQGVDEIVLFQSELHPKGAVHTPLSHLKLGN